MSAFIGAALATNYVDKSDERINRPDFLPQGALHAECISAVAPASFESEWWPKGGGFCGDMGADVGLLEAAWWGEYDPAGGAASRFGFVGVTRDQYGSALGGCTVKLFRTSDDALLDSTVSDPTGAFLLNTAYYPDEHWIKLHKDGSPDFDGVTQDNLVGT